MFWGLSFSGAGLKNWGAYSGMQTLFVSQGIALDFEFPADCGLLNRGWSLWWNQVSAYPPYLDVALFLFADVKQLLSE